MNALLARLHHYRAPGQSHETAAACARILTRPCFDVLSRVSLVRGDRQLNHRAKNASIIAEYLARPHADAVLLDSGREGDPVAAAMIKTGRAGATPGAGRPELLLSYAVLPLDGDAAAVLDGLRDLAVALDAVAGMVTAEDSFLKAQGLALSIHQDRRGDVAAGRITQERLRERAAHLLLSANPAEKVGAPEWGLFLGAAHLSALPPAALRPGAVFSEVRTLAPGRLVYVQMTDDPNDSLRPEFEERIATARALLRPVLMDSSQVPESVWS